jgi:hypothetical protein
MYKDNKDYSECIDTTIKKYNNLSRTIEKLQFEKPITETLNDARVARNDIAHVISLGFDGCLDGKSLNEFKEDTIIPLVKKIAEGDYIMSMFMSSLNKEPLPNFTKKNYSQKIIDWVVNTED